MSQCAPKLLAVVGYSNSGKTTVVEFLISRLSQRGWKIGSAKHIHHKGFSIDHEGKDTWRHTRAGAKITAGVAEREWVLIMRDKGAPESLNEVLELFKGQDLDLIVLEGFFSLVSKQPGGLKIATAKELSDLQPLVKLLAPPVLAASGKVAAEKRGKSLGSLPLVDIYTEGEKILKIVEAALAEG